MEKNEVDILEKQIEERYVHTYLAQQSNNNNQIQVSNLRNISKILHSAKFGFHFSQMQSYRSLLRANSESPVK